MKTQITGFLLKRLIQCIQENAMFSDRRSVRANTRLHIHTVSPEGLAGARGVRIVALSISFHEQTN